MSNRLTAAEKRQNEQATRNVVQTMRKAKELAQRRGYELKQAIPVAKRYTRMFPAQA